MKNIHVLSTNKPSILVYDTNDDLNLTSMKMVQEFSNKKVHIYITSDEEIKEGDVVKIPCGVGKVKELTWKFGNDNPSYIIEDIFIYKLRYGQKEGELQINSFRYEDVKKIVITTDQDLIDDGVQAIDDEFLEWFINNSNCEEIEVVDVRSLGVYGSYYPYKINIPKKETKQETLEEAAKRCFEEMKILNPRGSIKEFIRMAVNFGAKWQQEQEQNNENSWFNEYQKLEDYIIKRIADKFLEATPEKYNTASEATIALIENNWQQERMYNEEEVLELLNKREDYINSEDNIFEYQDAKKWFEKFKKK